MPLSRRDFLSSSAITLAGAFCAARSGSTPRFTRDDTIVETTYGKLRGARDNGVSAFLGVPYAGRVSGDRRFRRPAPLVPWTHVRDALRLGPPAIQAPVHRSGRWSRCPTKTASCSTSGPRRPTRESGR